MDNWIQNIKIYSSNISHTNFFIKLSENLVKETTFPFSFSPVEWIARWFFFHITITWTSSLNISIFHVISIFYLWKKNFYFILLRLLQQSCRIWKKKKNIKTFFYKYILLRFYKLTKQNVNNQIIGKQETYGSVIPTPLKCFREQK